MKENTGDANFNLLKSTCKALELKWERNVWFETNIFLYKEEAFYTEGQSFVYNDLRTQDI